MLDQVHTKYMQRKSNDVGRQFSHHLHSTKKDFMVPSQLILLQVPDNTRKNLLRLSFNPKLLLKVEYLDLARNVLLLMPIKMHFLAPVNTPPH
jgi:hypothetical protein